jgi:hypothetical protein
MRKALALILRLIPAAVIVGAAVAAYLFRYELSDWWVLRDYTPPTRIAQLADQAKLTDTGRRLLYRSKPQIDSDRQTLTRDCRIQSEKTIELGCYLSLDKIYLLDITQEELRDEMVVTTAHETLHAAYVRMGKGERSQVDAQLRAVAASMTDTKLKQRLADYGRLEPGEEANELHSILGTEYRQLTPELEAHYARYLSDRPTVVAYNDAFSKTFDGLHDQILQLDVKIKARKKQMDVLLSQGKISQYNALVPSINADITVYNQKVDQYNRYSSILLGEPPVTPAASVAH